MSKIYLLKESFSKHQSVYIISILTIIGLVLIFVSSLDFQSYEAGKCIFRFIDWQDLLAKLGSVLLAGVILEIITNLDSFTNLFSENLAKVVYAEEFLSKRKDLDDIWSKVSRQLYSNKFPEISDEFLNQITMYFPTDVVSYYDNYRRCISIQWADDTKDLVNVSERISFDLVANDTKEFSHTLWNMYCPHDNGEKSITNVKINGVAIECTPQIKDLQNRQKESTFEIHLHGLNKYNIEYQSEKTYKLSEDHFIGFKAKYILNGMYFVIENMPEEIHAQIISRGLLDESKFKDDVCVNSIAKRYTGIVLPKQGYVISLYRKF